MFGLNPWALVGAGLFYIASITGAFFYGEHIDNVENKAAQLATVQKQLAEFKDGVNGMIKDAAAAAFKEFDARTTVLADVATQLTNLTGVQRDNGKTLAAALRGRFVLSPAERVHLECLRRPDDPRCPHAAVPSAIPGAVAGPPPAR